jgi:hypothetical protein
MARLAEFRRTYYLDLYSSGRWSKTYTEAQFILLMREVLAPADAWAEIVPRTAAPADPSQPHERPAGLPYRTAA